MSLPRETKFYVNGKEWKTASQTGNGFDMVRIKAKFVKCPDPDCKAVGRDVPDENGRWLVIALFENGKMRRHGFLCAFCRAFVEVEGFEDE